MHKKTFTLDTKNLHYKNCALDKIVNLQICEMCICRNVHCAESCICKKVCAADLRNLCTTVFRTFADLRICVLQTCAESFMHEIIFSS